MTKILSLCLTIALFWTPAMARPQQSDARSNKLVVAGPSMRELDWDTYLDKVQGAWMGKMIGVTFGAPWEFQYQGTPIGFDITDWPLSSTRMKEYRHH